MTSRSSFLLISFLFIVGAALSAQTEFSAEAVNSFGGTKQLSKIFVDKDKMRIESQLTHESGPSILDFSTRTTRIVIADHKTYMEAPPGVSLQRGYAFFRPADVENACDLWLKLVFRPESTCRKIGDVTVNGRDAVEYEGKSPEGDASHVWIDVKLAFPIKWDSKGGYGEVRNIQEGPQAANLFEIPTDYTKIEGLSTTHHHAH